MDLNSILLHLPANKLAKLGRHRCFNTEYVPGFEGDLPERCQPRWSEYFAWTTDCTKCIGLTPIGRAIVVTLHLNRVESINLRRVLYNTGEHPPEMYMIH